jgi:hypothetical protein
MAETLQDLYGKLEKANIKLPDYNTFEKKYNTEGGADILYEKLNSANVKLPDVNTFKTKYFSNSSTQEVIVPTGKTVDGIPTVTLENQSINQRPEIALTQNKEKSQTIPFYGFDLVLPKTTNKETEDNDPTPYKGLLAFNVAKSLKDFSAPLPLEQTAKEIDLLKSANPDQISEFTKAKKQEVNNFYNQQKAKLVTLDTPDQATDYGKLEEEQRQAEKEIDNTAIQKSFTNAPFMYNNINDYLNAPDDIILKNAELVGNDIQNITDDKKRTYVKTTSGVNVPGVGVDKIVKENLTYLGLQAEAASTTASINDDTKTLETSINKINELIAQLNENPNQPDLVKQVQEINQNEILPLQQIIKTKETFLVKLQSVGKTLPEIEKQIKRQKEVDENFLKYSIDVAKIPLEGITPSILLPAIGYAAKGLSNRLTNTLKGSAIIANDIAERLGTKSIEETTRQNINLLSDESLQFTLPKKIKEGDILEKDKEGNITGVNANVALPMIFQTTAEMLTMGGIAAPLAQYGTLGKIAGLYIGSTAVFGGDILKGELEKGLTVPEATAVTGLRLGIEAGTELINPSGLIPFNGVIKKGILNKAISKSAYIDFIIQNAPTLIPKWKKMGLDAARIIYLGAKGTVAESGEEVASDFGNMVLDKIVALGIKPDYRQDHEFTVENEINTALTTALTMLPMGGYQGIMERQAEKQAPIIRWSASQTPKIFLDNLESNLKKGLITKEFYETGKKEVETINGLYEANKLKIDNTEEEQRPTYLNLLYEQKQISDKILSTTSDEESEKLGKELEDVSKKLQYFDSEALDNIRATPIQKNQKIEKRHIDNLKQFASEEELNSATIEDLNSAKSILSNVVSNPFSEKVKTEAENQLVKIDEKIVQLQEQKLKEQEVPKKSVIEQEKENINTLSKEELTSYNPFTNKELSKEEKKQLNEAKLERLQQLEDKETNVTFGDKTFKKGEQVTLDEGKSYWNVDGLAEDGRLKLSRKFNNTTESTIASDPNDVKPYTFKEKETKETPTEEITATEDLKKAFGIEEEIPTEEQTQESSVGVGGDVEIALEKELNELGQKQLTQGFNKLSEATKPEQVAAAIVNIEQNKNQGARLSKEQEQQLSEAKAKLKEQGYEIVDYNIVRSGENTIVQGADFYNNQKDVLTEEQANAIESRINLLEKRGEEVNVDDLPSPVSRTIKPLIKKDGKMVQAAEVNTLIFESVEQAKEAIKKSKEVGYKKPNAADKIKSKGIEQSLKETPQAGSVGVGGDVEDKKADIERRRQEELNKKNEQGYSLPMLIKDREEALVRQNKSRDEAIAKGIKDLAPYNQGVAMVAGALNRYNKSVKEINAKYDAELDALEQPKEEKEIISEPVVEQEVSKVKLQELEQAKKQQDKEVLEKFEAPATPFKNGKVKTSNWNKVISTITPANLLNYRVKVVNTSSLAFEQLPFQTKKYFEDEALKQKTTVEDVMSKDKGKMLVLTDKEGTYILEEDLPVITNFSDGKLAEYKVQYERQGLTEQQYFDKIEEIKKARENNSTLLIDKISNYPVEITKDTNELSVAIGENDFSITKGNKGFPVVKIGEQEINLTSRKLNQDEIDSISYILFKRWATSGGMDDVKSDKYQKAQYVQKLILSGTGVGKINFKGDPKARTWEITLKQSDGLWKTANEQEVRDFLKNQWINIDINLSNQNIPFTTYKMEEGKTIVDKTYPTYKDFIKATLKTKGTSVTKLQDNFYIEVGDVDNTLSAEITKATEEKAPEVIVTEKPVKNTSIEQENPADLDFLEQIKNKKKKSIDSPKSKDDFSGLLRNKKLSQEVTEEQNKKAKEWFDNSPLKNYITLNQLQNIVNSDAYASWNWGAINLFKGSQYTDLYHEAWHEFSQLYLTKKQKEALYNEVKNLPQYKGYSNKQIEEVIAEDFRNYALSNGKLILNNRYQRNSIFRKIWNLIKEWVTGNTDLQTVYERLYTGNVSKYKRNLNNAFWGNLNLGIETQDGKQLSDTDTKNLYRAIDSLVGTIFQQNGKPVTMMFADNKVLSVVYGAIYKKFATEYNELLESIEQRSKQKLSINDVEKLKVDVQILNNLEDVVNNWNKIVENHKRYSAFFNISKDKITFDEEGNVVSIDDKFTEETDEGNSKESELIKNENVSSKEAASNETIFTIATLPRYNPDGTRAMNPFLPFVQDVVDFNSTWDKLTTATNNHLEYTQILAKIEELGEKDKSFQDLLQRLPDSNKSLTDDEQRMKGAFMNDISKPLVQVYELIMTPVDGKMFFSYKTAASSDLDKIKRQWNDAFETISPFIKEHPDGSLYTDKDEIKAIYGAKGTKPAFYYNKKDYENADKKQMFENRIDFLSKIGITFTEEILSDPEFQDLITKDFVKTLYTKQSSTFSLYELLTKATQDISSLSQLSKVKPSGTEFGYFAKSIEELANYELLGSNSLFAQSVKNAEQNNVWQIRQWNYITKIFNALNDVEKYPTYQDLIGLDSETGEAKNSWLQQFNFDTNPYVKGIYLNTLFDLTPNSKTFGQRRVIKKGNKTIYPTISLHDYNGMRLNLADNKTNEGKGTTSLTAFEKIVQNINSLLLFNTQENLRYGDKSSSFSTSISHYVNAKTGKLEERKSIISFESFINNREAVVLPEEAYKYLVADLKQEIIPMIRFEHENVGKNLKYYNENIKSFGTFDGILSKETKEAITNQIIKPNLQDEKEIAKILNSLPLREEFETYITDKSKQLSDLLDTQGILEDIDIFDPKLIEEKVKTPEGKTISQPLPRQSMLYGYIVNSLLYNIEHTKIISFDPRFYKNAKNVIKRLSAWSATGNIFVVDEQTNNYIDNKGNAIKDAVAKKLGIQIPKIFSDGKIRSVIFKDNEYSASVLFENYKKKFLVTGKYTSEQINTVLKAYNSVNEADGQGYVTLDLLRQSKYRAGSSHWTKEHEAAYQKEAKFLAGESTTGMSSEEMVLFTPQKWQYAGIGLTENNAPYPTFYKFSVVPLIPSAIKGTNFEKIHDNLVKQNVGLALFESGSKASGELNQDGKYNSFYSNYETRTPYEGEYTINNVFFQYLKEQVNVEPELKEKVSFSTQMRKLLHLNLYNNGVPNDVKLSSEEWHKLSKSEKLKQSDIFKSEQRFGDVIENLIKIEQESILKKMGATKQSDGNYKLDAEKLAEFFKEEFIKRDLPNEVVNYLQAFEGEFLFPIDAFKQRATIERIAYSIANKKLVQQKITGEALVQVASTGFEITDKFSSVKEDSDLPFYTEPGKAQKIKIAFTKRWKPLLNLEYNGKRIGTIDKLNEAIKDEKWLEQNKKAITIVGVRIPVQGLNSQEYMEVFHFLPESMGNVIVVSPALVAKSGGDFDIDKLTTFFPNLNKKGDVITKQSEEQLKKVYNAIVSKYKKEDKAVDKLISAIFGVTDEELQEELIQELIENKEIIPFEQFKNIQDKKAYENELIDIIKETLSRPDNFLQLVRPNDTDLLNNKEYGAGKLKELFSNKYEDNTFTFVIDFGSILEAFKSNLVGKSNLGIAAVNNVLFSLAQRAGLHHNETFTYRNFSGKFKTKPVEFYLPHNTIKVGNKELVSLSGLFSKDSNNYVSDIISQYINGFVDVANDDWVFFINAVKEFAPTMLYTAMAGTNAKTTIAFFNQPIMREYIKNVDKYKNLFTKLKSPQDYTMGNWKALEDAVYTYIQQDEKLLEVYEKGNEKGLPFIAIRKYVNESVSPKFLTEERLSEALYGDKPLTPEQEIFLIYHFWELRRQSGVLTNLQRSLNADTKKVGNGYSSIERQTMFDDVLKSNLFNADAMYRMRNESTIKAFTNDKTGFDKFSQQLFTDLFEVTNHPTFNKVIRELINNDKELNFEFKFSKLEKLVNTIKNDFITYLYHNQVLDGNDNLFKKTQALFNPKSSIALELRDIKEKYPNLSKEFPILDLIVPNNLKSDNKILKTNLKLKSRLVDKDELDFAVLQIRQLQTLDSIKYTPEQQIEIQQFTDRLVKFIIVQSGLNPSVYNLLDIIPNEAYTQNIKSIIKDVQKALNKDINTPFALKSDKKSASQKSLEKFYNRFRIENPEFYKFEPTDEELTLNFINQRGKNYYLPTTDITGAKAKAVEDKLLAYIPTLPSKSIIVDKNNGQTLKQNPKSLFVIYDNEKEDNKKALTQQKITNFATMVAIDKDVIDRQIDEIISKSMGYDTISFNLSKGYFQDIKESNPELFNYGSQRLKDTFGITNSGFKEVYEGEGEIDEIKLASDKIMNQIKLTPEDLEKGQEFVDFIESQEQEVIEQPINKKIKKDKKLNDRLNAANFDSILDYVKSIDIYRKELEPIYKALDKIGVKVIGKNVLALGTYVNKDNTIKMNHELFNGSKFNEAIRQAANIQDNLETFEKAFNHELIHALLYHYANPELDRSSSYFSSEFRDKLQSLWEEGNEFYKNEDVSKLSEPLQKTLKAAFESKYLEQELITYAFTDKEFADWLKSKKTDSKENTKSLWTKFLDLIGIVLNDIGSNNLLSKIVNTLNEIQITNEDIKNELTQEQPIVEKTKEENKILKYIEEFGKSNFDKLIKNYPDLSVLYVPNNAKLLDITEEEGEYESIDYDNLFKNIQNAQKAGLNIDNTNILIWNSNTEQSLTLNEFFNIIKNEINQINPRIFNKNQLDLFDQNINKIKPEGKPEIDITDQDNC